MNDYIIMYPSSSETERKGIIVGGVLLRYLKILLIVLFTLFILTSCKGQISASPSQNNNSNHTAPIESNEELQYGNFSYGDELDFYKNDEKSNKNPTAINVVTKYLEAMRENDYEAWLSTMAEERQQGFRSNEKHELGTVSLDIIDIHYETDLKYKHKVVKCEKAVSMGLTADNIAIIYALYNAKYDHTKVPSDDGEIEWHFTLIRKDKDSPWLIQAWGYGYGGI